MPRAPEPGGDGGNVIPNEPDPLHPGTLPGPHVNPTIPKQPVVTTVTTPGTLGEIPGLYDLLQKQRAQMAPPPSDPLDLENEGSPLDALSFTNPEVGTPDSHVGELSFDGAGPTVDPMSDLHMPSLESMGIQLPTTTTTTTTGAPTQGGDMVGSGAKGWRKQVVAFARSMLGTPYVWGGTSQSGVDCSGLVLLAFQAAGRHMPRISADQARQGKRVGLNDLKPGDLVAWDNSSRNNGADHIAIYIGNGLIIEAPRPGRNVQISHLYDTGEAWGVSFG